MLQPKPFGRRLDPHHRAPRPVQSVEAHDRPKEKGGHTNFAVRRVSPILPETKLVTRGDDFDEWSQSRKHGFAIPWRPLALMASLCFGVASFVLPDTVNDAVQYLLYGLTAAGMFAGVSGRRRAAKAGSTPYTDK